MSAADRDNLVAARIGIAVMLAQVAFLGDECVSAVDDGLAGAGECALVWIVIFAHEWVRIVWVADADAVIGVFARGLDAFALSEEGVADGLLMRVVVDAERFSGARIDERLVCVDAFVVDVYLPKRMWMFSISTLSSNPTTVIRLHMSE